MRKDIETNLKTEFGLDIPTLIKTKQQINKIANAIPKNWQNDSIQRSDVAYLFDKIDSKKIIDELTMNKEYIDIRYIKGAAIWNLGRKITTKAVQTN
jgi:uncharacterized protein (DUF1697 family)